MYSLLLFKLVPSCKTLHGIIFTPAAVTNRREVKKILNNNFIFSRPAGRFQYECNEPYGIRSLPHQRYIQSKFYFLFIFEIIRKSWLYIYLSFKWKCQWPVDILIGNNALVVEVKKFYNVSYTNYFHYFNIDKA